MHERLTSELLTDVVKTMREKAISPVDINGEKFYVLDATETLIHMGNEIDDLKRQLAEAEGKLEKAMSEIRVDDIEQWAKWVIAVEPTEFPVPEIATKVAYAVMEALAAKEGEEGER